jgi:hypothetical protein
VFYDQTGKWKRNKKELDVVITSRSIKLCKKDSKKNKIYYDFSFTKQVMAWNLVSNKALNQDAFSLEVVDIKKANKKVSNEELRTLTFVFVPRNKKHASQMCKACRYNVDRIKQQVSVEKEKTAHQAAKRSVPPPPPSASMPAHIAEKYGVHQDKYAKSKKARASSSSSSPPPPSSSSTAASSSVSAAKEKEKAKKKSKEIRAKADVAAPALRRTQTTTTTAAKGGDKPSLPRAVTSTSSSSPLPGKVSSTAWDCEVCTFHNAKTAVKCVMCSTPRGAKVDTQAALR